MLWPGPGSARHPLPTPSCPWCRQVVCLTFGAPRPGNHAFARVFRRLVPLCFDVINGQDAVAKQGELPEAELSVLHFQCCVVLWW